MNYKTNPKFKIVPTSLGFTLIETLLVILLFSVLAVLMGGVFVSSLDLQRRAFNLQQTEENVNFTLELMAKEIRVSQVAIPDGSGCSSLSDTTLNVTHPVNGNIVYSLSGGAIHRNVNGTDSIISSNTVEFTNMRFCVSGALIGDQQQPRVTILGTLKSIKSRQQAIINFQTTVSQRFLSN
ncbi:MAG: type II secretion system protein [Candidatus Yanofskybacteria bacterium]|nr:type II secretion system protein [Candidatus Yanofskybacteria bacterium]